MVKEYTHLDFESYIRVEHGYTMIPEPDSKFAVLSDLYDRACGTLYLAARIHGKSDRSGVSDKALKQAMLRSALAEFFSIGDYIKEFYPTHGKGLWFNEHAHTDPILHMLKLLRNYNVHVETSILGTKSMSVMIPAFPENVVTISVPFISNLSVEGFARVDAAPRYKSCLQRMIDVFEEQQHIFGIDTLIMKCLLVNMQKLDVLLEFHKC